MIAEVKNETWMPWGTTEVAMDVAKWRSVRSELRCE
jgi:hypothetical protein